MRLKNKIVAITGAGQGIGRAAAELFADEAAEVYLLEINEQSGLEVEKIINDRGGRAYFIKTDVSNADSVNEAFTKIENLDILYNNAAIFLSKYDGKISDISFQAWDRIIKCNLFGFYHCCKYGVNKIRQNGGGVIINTSSSAAVMGIPGCDAYTATKGAVLSLTRSLAVEYGPENIRVNCIVPAGIFTPMIEESNLNNPDFDEESFLNQTPLRRWGTAKDIARLALFLASDESAYLNGAIILADGGITIRPFF
ncbi:MAG: SDR family NAD(P)-dependent oxidoreductase [Planctomycetota bacterium]